MKLDGGSHCGSITYEAEIDPGEVRICHCTNCQTLSGTAFRTMVPVPEDVFTLSGDPKSYVRTAESGAKRAQAFCPECGAPIYSTAVGGGPKVHDIRLGTARQRDELPPKAQVWFRSAQHWLTDLNSIPKIETG
jgi:hypothetical protein